MGLFSSVKRTPINLQLEATECGAAALGAVLSYYGLHMPLEILRQECGVSRDGVTAINIVRAARRFGMEAKGFRYSSEELLKLDMPVIIHWEFNHFLVLEGFRGDRAFLNDPASGHRSVTIEEFKNSFTGVVLALKPGADFKKGGKKYSTKGIIASKLLREKSALLFIMIIALLLVVTGLAAPVFNQIFIDDVLSGKHVNWLTNLMIAMGVACSLDISLNFLRNRILAGWLTKMTLIDASSFFRHVFRLPMKFFQQRYSGEIAMRVSFHGQIAETLTGQAATAVIDMLVALFYIVLLVQYSPILTLIGVSFSALNMAVFVFIRKRLTEISMKIQLDAGKLASASLSGIQAIETLKANGNEADFFSKWAGYQAKYISASQDVSRVAQVMLTLPALLSGINGALIMAFGGFQIMDGIMSAGIFMAFRSLMGNFQAPIQKIMSLAQSLQDTEAMMRKVDDVHRYEIEDEKSDTSAFPPDKTKLSGRVELSGVTFGYSPLSDPLIEDFSLSVEPGRWVALVGASGSGKSTISNIISGLYREWSGRVLFDGYERKDIPKETIINSISMVDQNVSLFSGTVKENISLFDPTISNDDITSGARDAMIHDDISALDGSYEHDVDEGGNNFSGGQRQRIEIARALASDPSILIFDEATSALDPVTEERVLSNIRRRGCTCIMVAHRLSAFRDCDEIIVLDCGRVVQRGTHHSMIQTDGPYSRLISNRLFAADSGRAFE